MPFFSRLHLLLEGENLLPGDWNMAVDRALLETQATAVLRVYGWAERTVSVGCRFRGRELLGLPGWPVVQRWTGGGVVLHDGDVTYTLVVPVSERWCALRSAAIYEALHSSLAGLLVGETGLPYEVAGEDCGVGELCFSGWSKSDLLLRGKKVGGAGMRRCRQGLLLQGSLQVSGLGPDFWRGVAGRWAAEVGEISLPEAAAIRARELLLLARLLQSGADAP